MEINLYHYVPNVGAAVVFVIFFVLAACLHIWSMVRTRSWFYIPLIIGTFFEALGYAFRIYSHFNVTSVTGYAGQSVLILIAPPLIAATIYMSLARIIRALNAESLSIVRSSWLTRIFVTGDIFCFLLQSTGGGLQVKGGDDAAKFELGKNIIVGGLVLQVVLFAFFVVIAAVIYARLRAFTNNFSLSWKPQMTALFTASACILVRNIVRIVEYAQGFDGYIMTHEVFIYVFDAVLMLGVVILLWFVHVGEFLQNATREEPAEFMLEPESGMRRGVIIDRKIAIRHSQD